MRACRSCLAVVELARLVACASAASLSVGKRAFSAQIDWGQAAADEYAMAMMTQTARAAGVFGWSESWFVRACRSCPAVSGWAAWDRPPLPSTPARG